MSDGVALRVRSTSLSRDGGGLADRAPVAEQIGDRLSGPEDPDRNVLDQVFLDPRCEPRR